MDGAHPADPPRPTICLTMIARNEAHVIGEVIASVAPHIDTWVVVDTGSDDDTPAAVRDAFGRLGVDGEVVERPWRDFATNRSEALALARDRADYSWMIDADDLLVGSPDLGGLDADAYSLRYRARLEFWRTQLFRNDRRWEYVGVVHEYPRCLDGDPDIRRLDGDYAVLFRSLGDRSRDPARFARDAELLEAAHRDDPDDPRTVFYLAQSHRDAGDPAAALEWYERRIAMGGWEEETFRAMLERARLLEQLGRPRELVVGAYLACWQFRPTRAEPLDDLARLCRLDDAHDLAVLFARRGVEIPHPSDDQLFVEPEAYTWRLLDSLAISSFYVGRHRESFDACVALLAGDDLPEAERARVHENRDFAAPAVMAETAVHPEAVVAALVERHGVGGVRRPPGDVTVTITTCRRPELFDTTMSSFLRCCTDLDRVTRWVCIDDGSDDEACARMVDRFPFLELVRKERADAGHARSMNRLAGLVGTPWWLHLEDDWHFFVPGDHLGRALAVLDDDPSLGQVLFNRAYAETLEDRALVGGEVRWTSSGVRHWRQVHLEGDDLASYVAEMEPGTRTNAWWPHFSLRPSVLRTAAIAGVGSFAEDAEHFELEYAHRYVAAGWRSAAFDDVTCVHLGPLTSDHGPDRAPNAYDLNGQPQFGRSPRC